MSYDKLLEPDEIYEQPRLPHYGVTLYNGSVVFLFQNPHGNWLPSGAIPLYLMDQVYSYARKKRRWEIAVTPEEL